MMLRLYPSKLNVQNEEALRHGMQLSVLQTVREQLPHSFLWFAVPSSLVSNALSHKVVSMWD